MKPFWVVLFALLPTILPAQEVPPKPIGTDGLGRTLLWRADAKRIDVVEAKKGAPNLVLSLQNPLREPTHWVDPWAAVASPDGKVTFVADTGAHRVCMFALDGSPLGDVEGDFHYPHTLAFAGGYLFVRNRPREQFESRCMPVFDRDLTLVAELEGGDPWEREFTYNRIPSQLSGQDDWLTASHHGTVVRFRVEDPVKSIPQELGPRQVFRRTVTLGGSGEYVVVTNGTVDEFNTESLLSPGQCLFQPNRWVKIENIGDVPVANPRLVVDGRRTWFSYGDMMEDIFDGRKTDEEKSYVLWDWCRRTTTEGPTSGDHLWKHRSTTRFFNTFGTGACGTYNMAMPLLGEGAGLTVHSGVQADGSHAVQTEDYGGQQRYFDCLLRHAGGQPQGLFALRHDNRQIASSDQIREDHYLMARSGSDPHHAYTVSLFGPRGGFSLHRKKFEDPWNMGMTLRPGESVTLNWHANNNTWMKGGKVYTTGLVRYVPPKPAAQVYRMYSPWLITGARADAAFHRGAPDATIEISFSLNGRDWQEIWKASEGCPERIVVSPGILKEFRGDLFTHEVFFRIESPHPQSRIESLSLELDFQANSLSLPSLASGENRVQYRDDTAEPHKVRITHAWVETRVDEPPHAPELLHPRDGSKVGTKTFFEWKLVLDATANEFYLSPREDLAWPLLPNFHAITDWIPRFAPPAPDAFNPGQTYYWRVRARSRGGVWGAWSETFRFTAVGPTPVRKLREEADPASGRVFLRWEPGPEPGTTPARYEVYGSAERGFTPLRKKTPRKLPNMDLEDPANLITEVDKPEFEITGRTECFYRVAAVDADLNRSSYGPYLEVRHPRLLPAELPEAAKGKPYEAEVPCVLDRGMWVWYLRGGMKKWRFDEPKFALEGAPGWMSIDAATGKISGTPDQPGEAAFAITVEVPKRGKDRREHRVEVR